nr:hypothetical protein [Thaumasiovibrio occultus]
MAEQDIDPINKNLSKDLKRLTPCRAILCPFTRTLYRLMLSFDIENV